MPQNRVTLLRESLGWSRKLLSDFLDVHERTIYRYERGDTSIPDETKARLCSLFGVSLDHLMGMTSVTHRAGLSRLRELRCERGLSQPQLAKALLAQALLARDPRVGASSPDAGTIGRWEQDGGIPDEQTLALAEFFGVAATYLLGYTQPPEDDDDRAGENELAAVIELHPRSGPSS